jgi:hypothetical protein
MGGMLPSIVLLVLMIPVIYSCGRRVYYYLVWILESVMFVLARPDPVSYVQRPKPPSPGAF